jgi:hypothetical protein
MSNLDKKITSFERSSTPVSRYLTGEEKTSLGADLVAWVDDHVATIISFGTLDGYYANASKEKLDYLAKITIREIYNLARKEMSRP